MRLVATWAVLLLALSTLTGAAGDRHDQPDHRPNGGSGSSDQPVTKVPDSAEPPSLDPGALRQPDGPSYYPPRPSLPGDQPGVAALLDEIETEARDELPLYGQGIFRQEIIERSLRGSQPEVVVSPPPSYQMAPGDQFVVTFWNPLVPPKQVATQVQNDGTVGFDPIGVVQVGGLAVPDFERLLTTQLRRKGPKDAQVRISYSNLHALRVAVRGEVRRVSTGVVVNGFATLFDALAAAGGPTAHAAVRQITLYRGTQTQTIDLYQFLLTGDPKANVALRDGDSIYVPVATRLVAVAGAVARPARYELLREQTIVEALQLAGGPTGKAARLQVSRVRDYTQPTKYDFPLGEVIGQKADLREVEPLRQGDEVEVLAAAAAAATVRVVGAVGRPGEYGWEAGLTLAAAVAKAQGITRDGFVGVGAIRRVRSDGQVESLPFEVADLREGGAAAKLVLRPGDEVEILAKEQRSPVRVSVRGAVNKPGGYESTTALTVVDLLRTAGGVAELASTQAVLLSTSSGQPVETRIDLAPLARGAEPQPNPELRNGDLLTVLSLSELGALPEVRVVGLVRNPGAYPLTAAMTVRDLLQRCGGVLPRAASRAKLTRVVAGSADFERRYLDLTRALAGGPADNLPLREDDLLEVVTADEAAVAAPRQVTINGPVAKPGLYGRAVGMTVGDLLREAGGLRPEADRDVAFVLRQEAGGQTRRLRINPARALAGQAEDDLELADLDLVELQAWRSVTIEPPRVRVAGAVYRPNEYPLTAGMTVDDLLFLAGGPLPNAYLPRAELQRRAPGDRFRVLPLDLTVKPLLLPLAAGDQLEVYTHSRATVIEPMVSIKGFVANPGAYERGIGMTLSELVFRAGGLLCQPGFTTCEVARARDTRPLLFRPDLALALQGDKAQDLVLEDGDSIIIRRDGEYFKSTPEVLVRGRVRVPGLYSLTGNEDSLRALLMERAGGLQQGAFSAGAVLLRRVEEVVDPAAATFVNAIYDDLLQRKKQADLAAIMARSNSGNVPDQLPNAITDERVLPTAVVQPSEIITQDLDQAMGQAADGVEQFTGGHRAGQTRGSNGVPVGYVRVAIDLEAILNGQADLRMRPRDVLVVPNEPELVLLMGEVASTSAQQYVADKTLNWYVQRAGGVTSSADVKAALVIRANGTVAQAEHHTVIRRGDMILVPARPLEIPRDRRAMESVQAIASILGGFATTMVALTQAFK
ncbi:MAG: SLBB domain-containing protein [Fimbriimonadaceae bacterium]|nr:SLBB domain-containing protein [Fimbriimonadaceae bacterium]